MTVVLLTAFGYPALASVASAAGGSYVSGYAFDNLEMGGLILYEIAALALVAAFLKTRGWTLRDFNPEVTWHLTAAGLVLCFLILLSDQVMYSLFAGLGLIRPESCAPIDASGVGIPMVAAVCIVNPIFEESLVAAYVVEALRDRRPPLFAVNLSVSVRLLYHLYQGPIGVITIIPAGLLFALAYQRLNRLWPLVFAHGLLDAVGILDCR